jgi:hypothetical protein
MYESVCATHAEMMYGVHRSVYGNLMDLSLLCSELGYLLFTPDLCVCGLRTRACSWSSPTAPRLMALRGAAPRRLTTLRGAAPPRLMLLRGGATPRLRTLSGAAPPRLILRGATT